MAQERDDLVYLAKLAEQAERFDEMARRRRGGIITPFVYSSGQRRIDKGGAARERQRRGPRRFRERTRPGRRRIDEDGAARERPRRLRERARTQVEHMKVVARMPTELSVEERNLLWTSDAADAAETSAPADSQVGDV